MHASTPQTLHVIPNFSFLSKNNHVLCLSFSLGGGVGRGEQGWSHLSQRHLFPWLQEGTGTQRGIKGITEQMPPPTSDGASKILRTQRWFPRISTCPSPARSWQSVRCVLQQKGSLAPHARARTTIVCVKASHV